jgi:hypothetical protein
MFLMPRVASATAMPDLRGDAPLPFSLIAVRLRCGICAAGVCRRRGSWEDAGRSGLTSNRIDLGGEIAGVSSMRPGQFGEG